MAAEKALATWTGLIVFLLTATGAYVVRSFEYGSSTDSRLMRIETLIASNADTVQSLSVRVVDFPIVASLASRNATQISELALQVRELVTTTAKLGVMIDALVKSR